MFLRILKYILLFAILCLSHVSAKRKAQGKVKYELNWLSGFRPCEKYHNYEIDASRIELSRNSISHTGFSGDMVVIEEISEGTMIEITIERETLVGKQLMFVMEHDFCSNLSEEDMPWTSIVDALRLEPKSCPIPAKTYSLEDCRLNMAFAKKVLSHEFVGQYVTRVTLKQPVEGLGLAPHTIACFNVAASVDETREQAESDAGT